MTQLTVDLKGYYENMIKGQWAFIDAFNEQPHNTFDNGGSFIDLSFYDKKYEIIKITEENKSEIIKNPHIMVFKDNCMNYLKNPEKIMKTLSEKVKHKGVGNFNLGEIGSIFNLGVSCTYITPNDSFKIEENFHGFPELSYFEESVALEILKKLKLPRPLIGTLKIFYLTPNKIIDIDDLKKVAKKTSLSINVNKEKLPSYVFNYMRLSKDYHYKDAETVYGIWNHSHKVINFYMKVETLGLGGNHKYFLQMKTDIGKFPTQPSIVAKEHTNYFYDKKYMYQTIKDNADLCLTFKTSLYPFGEAKTKPKFVNEQGMIHLFQHEKGWLVLHDQNECEKFAEYTIPYYGRKSKVNGVWRGLESISHFEILKTNHKNEILEEMGFFPIKSKGKNLYECHQFRNISRIIFEKQLFHFANCRGKDGGGDKWDNITVDENNVWRDSKNDIMEEKTKSYQVQGHERQLVKRDDVIDALEYLEDKMNEYGITSLEALILSENIQKAFYSNTLGIKSEDIDCMFNDPPCEFIKKVRYWYLKKYQKNSKAKGGTEIKRIESLERSREMS